MKPGSQDRKMDEYGIRNANMETVSLSVHGSRISRGQLGLQPNLTKSWPNRAELGVQVVRPGVRFLL